MKFLIWLIRKQLDICPIHKVPFVRVTRPNLVIPNGSPSSNIQSKIKSTNLENCGYEWTTLDPNMKEKSRNTCLEKWGVPNATQRNFSKETLRILNNPDILQKEVNDIGTARLAIKLDIAFSTLYNYMMKHGVTSNHGNQYEKEIEEWLSDNKISFQKHNRSEIKPYELDFYLYEDKKA